MNNTDCINNLISFNNQVSFVHKLIHNPNARNKLKVNDMEFIIEPKCCNVTKITEKHIELFNDILSLDSNIKTIFDSTDYSSVFFKIYPSLYLLLLDRDLTEEDLVKFKPTPNLLKLGSELFYAAKNGYYYIGVPSILIYILNKAFDYEYDRNIKPINTCLNRCYKYLIKYVNYYFKTANGNMSLLDIIEVVCGSNKLLTSTSLKTSVSNYFEMWVSNVEQVVILPRYLAIKIRNVKNIVYDEKLGVCELATQDSKLYPIRTYGDNIGFTYFEFDLRYCI